MYARVVTVHVQPGRLEAFPAAFHERILSGMTQAAGFKGIYLLQAGAENKLVAMVLWETEAEAQAGAAGWLEDMLTGAPVAETLEVILRA